MWKTNYIKTNCTTLSFIFYFEKHDTHLHIFINKQDILIFYQSLFCDLSRTYYGLHNTTYKLKPYHYSYEFFACMLNWLPIFVLSHFSLHPGNPA